MTNNPLHVQPAHGHVIEAAHTTQARVVITHRTLAGETRTRVGRVENYRFPQRQPHRLLVEFCDEVPNPETGEAKEVRSVYLDTIIGPIIFL